MKTSEPTFVLTRACSRGDDHLSEHLAVEQEAHRLRRLGEREHTVDDGLDPAARVRMLKLIREIRETRDIHLIISSHLLRDVEECCEEVLILKDGGVAAYCDLEKERRSTLNFIELETYGSEGEFAAAIDHLGCDYADLGQGKFKMVLNEGTGVSDLYRIAAERNVQIRRLNHRHDSLQDIFLKAMEVPNGRI